MTFQLVQLHKKLECPTQYEDFSPNVHFSHFVPMENSQSRTDNLVIGLCALKSHVIKLISDGQTNFSVVHNLMYIGCNIIDVYMYIHSHETLA